MNHDQYPYNPEWHERGVEGAWSLVAPYPPVGRVLDRDVFTIAKYHGVDDATAHELARLLNDDWSGMSVLWVERMRDIDGWVKTVSRRVPTYLKPARVKNMINGRLRCLDPFDPDTIRVNAFMAAVEAGADVVSTDLRTGEVTERYSTPGSRPGAAPQN